ASKQMEQEGLDLVILRVAQRDGGAVGLARGPAQEHVAGSASRTLRMWRVAGGAGGVKLIAPPGRHRRHEVAVVLAIRTPAVVEMGHREVQRNSWKDLAQDREQGQRVGSARDRDHDALARLEDVM